MLEAPDSEGSILMPTYKLVRLRFQNGLSFETAVRDILRYLPPEEYRFSEDRTRPQVVVFGPYGSSEVPPPGDYVRVGYFCENVLPPMDLCDYAFGNVSESLVGHRNYARIVWHGFHPDDLFRDPAEDAGQLLKEKTRFCNFVYGSPVPYRERFAAALNKRKRVDCPGARLNNMPSFDQPGTDRFLAKRRFLRSYRFTIAFENDSLPGYRTEKMIDPLFARSVPIYFGDPEIATVYNPGAFINAMDFVCSGSDDWLADALHSRTLPTWEEYSAPGSLATKVRRKTKAIGRRLRMRWMTRRGYRDLLDYVLQVDADETCYVRYLTAPPFHPQRLPDMSRQVNLWRRVFESV